MEHRIVINTQDGFDTIPLPGHGLSDILVAITHAPSKFAKDLICKQLSAQYNCEIYVEEIFLEKGCAVSGSYLNLNDQIKLNQAGTYNPNSTNPTTGYKTTTGYQR